MRIAWFNSSGQRVEHNSRDFACIKWWGDRSGGSTQERCPICNPN